MPIPIKDVYTTGSVAKLLSVAPRTVSKWIDSGRLKGYRIPLSLDRRVTRQELIKFIKANGLPGSALLAHIPDTDGRTFVQALENVRAFALGKGHDKDWLCKDSLMVVDNCDSLLFQVNELSITK